MGTANPVGSDGGPVVAGSPIGPCETLSPLFHDALGPLEHSVPAEMILGLDPLEHSGLDQAGPVGRHFADVAGRSRPVVPTGGSSSVGTANPVGSDGPVVTGSPIDLCGTLSPLFQDALGPFGHSVPDETILAGPVGRHVAGGPVGPDETLLGLDPLDHSGLDRADPAGQHAAVGPVGLFGTLSPSDCYPALQRDFSVGTWTVILKINMRHLMVCQCIMAVICMIQRIRIGTTRTPLPAWRTWRTITFMFRRGWISWSIVIAGFQESSDVRQDCQMDVAPVYQTVWCRILTVQCQGCILCCFRRWVHDGPRYGHVGHCGLW